MIFYVCQKGLKQDEQNGRTLQKALNRPVWLLYWDAGLPFRKNLEAMSQEAWHNGDGFDVIAGEGMGGFYALEAAKDITTCAVAFSPAMHPKERLKDQSAEVRGSYPDSLRVPEWLPVAGFASENDPDIVLARDFFADFKVLGDGHWTEQPECIETVRQYENITGNVPLN